MQRVKKLIATRNSSEYAKGYVRLCTYEIFATEQATIDQSSKQSTNKHTGITVIVTLDSSSDKTKLFGSYLRTYLPSPS